MAVATSDIALIAMVSLLAVFLMKVVLKPKPCLTSFIRLYSDIDNMRNVDG